MPLLHGVLSSRAHPRAGCAEIRLTERERVVAQRGCELDERGRQITRGEARDAMRVEQGSGVDRERVGAARVARERGPEARARV